MGTQTGAGAINGSGARGGPDVRHLAGTTDRCRATTGGATLASGERARSPHRIPPMGVPCLIPRITERDASSRSGTPNDLPAIRERSSLPKPAAHLLFRAAGEHDERSVCWMPDVQCVDTFAPPQEPLCVDLPCGCSGCARAPRSISVDGTPVHVGRRQGGRGGDDPAGASGKRRGDTWPDFPATAGQCGLRAPRRGWRHGCRKVETGLRRGWSPAARFCQEMGR